MSSAICKIDEGAVPPMERVERLQTLRLTNSEVKVYSQLDVLFAFLVHLLKATCILGFYLSILYLCATCYLTFTCGTDYKRSPHALVPSFPLVSFGANSLYWSCFTILSLLMNLKNANCEESNWSCLEFLLWISYNKKLMLGLLFQNDAWTQMNLRTWCLRLFKARRWQNFIALTVCYF